LEKRGIALPSGAAVRNPKDATIVPLRTADGCCSLNSRATIDRGSYYSIADRYCRRAILRSGLGRGL